ncbi:MAG: mandelate racemase/muconate lactonizing enzyme family protein [Bryobacterales bacterium]|nr:mandelate racemase/muconate lactonizing enzyme family protein [Bryobacterales bacterium]
MTRRDWLRLAPMAALPSVLHAHEPSADSIEGLAIYYTQVGNRSWVLCELTTAGGLTGLGDASANERIPENATRIARNLFETINGRGPFEVERLRGKAMEVVSGTAPSEKRITVAACSALEQCMWDLQGKVLGLPCYALFGGALRKRIRNYANINRATRGADRTAEGFAKNARRGLQAGFDAFKLAPFDHMARNEADPERYAEGVSRGIGFVEAVREAIGPDRDLLIDGHSRFDAARAIEVSRKLEPFDLYWMEEMCRSTEDLRRFNDAVDVQTAGGESLWGVDGFYDYIRSGAVDAVMPDVKFCGGMYELKKIAAVAEGAGLLCSPHGPASPVGNMAAAHVCATMPNFDILEMAYGEVSWREDTVVPAERVESGYLEIPDRPGIGYEMNPDRWQRYDG